MSFLAVFKRRQTEGHTDNSILLDADNTDKSPEELSAIVKAQSQLLVQQKEVLQKQRELIQQQQSQIKVLEALVKEQKQKLAAPAKAAPKAPAKTPAKEAPKAVAPKAKVEEAAPNPTAAILKKLFGK